MKTTFPREFYLPQNAVEIKDPQSSAVAYLGTSKHSGKVHAVGFSGKRNKPDFNFTFRDEAQARKHIADHAAGVQSQEKAKSEWQAKRAAEKCRTPLDVWEKAKLRGSISAAETAICLRAELARQFPGVKFSVTSDNYSMGCSVDVRWTDGPRTKDVDAICDRYEFAGFDGMIDLKFHKSRWLSRDGSMTLAHSGGTGGSGGSCPEAIDDPHAPDCVLVSGGADYVSPSRKRSFAAELALARDVCQKFDIAMPTEFASELEFHRWLNNTSKVWSNGMLDWLSTLMHRHENEVNA